MRKMLLAAALWVAAHADGAVAQEALALAPAQRDFARLAAFVGPEGLILSPAVTVLLEKSPEGQSLRLKRREVETCAADRRVRSWGHTEAVGAPIRLRCGAFVDRYLRDADWAKADEILYNEKRQRSVDLNNNHELAPGGIVVEFHFKEGSPALKSPDEWQSLRLIFKRNPTGLTLVAITRDMFTV